MYENRPPPPGFLKTALAVTGGVLAYFGTVTLVLNATSTQAGASDVAASTTIEPREAFDDYMENPVRDHGMVSWTETADGEAEVMLYLPSEFATRNQQVYLHCSAHLGAMHTEWSQGPYVLDADTPTRTRIELNSSVYLDDAASDYVTALYVTVSIAGLRTLMPMAYIAWPDGPEGDPVVWTESQQTANAPYGVMTSELRTLGASLLDNSASILAAPVFGTATREVDDTGSLAAVHVAGSASDDQERPEVTR